MRLKCFFTIFFLVVLLAFTSYAQNPGSRTLKIEDVVAAPDNTFTVSMTISDAKDIAGGDIVVNYDNSILEFSNKLVMAQAFKSLNLAFKASNIGKIGEIRISIASPTGIKSGSGEFMVFTFKSLPNVQVGKETTIEIKKASIYDVSLNAIPVITQDGKVKIGYTCVAGDVNSDGLIDSRDAILTLRFAAEILIPTPIEQCAADVTNDGFIKSNDAIKILRMAVGLSAPSKEVKVAENRKTFAKLELFSETKKDIITILKLSNIENVSGGDITIVYDANKLRVVNVSSESNILFEYNTAKPGIIKVAFANIDRLDSNDLAQIRFETVSDGANSPITVKESVLYSFDGLTLNKANDIEKLTTSWGKIKASK